MRRAKSKRPLTPESLRHCWEPDVHTGEELPSSGVGRGPFLRRVSNTKCSGCHSTVYKQVTVSRLRRDTGVADSRGAQGGYGAQGNAQLALSSESVLRLGPLVTGLHFHQDQSQGLRRDLKRKRK